MRKTGRKWRTQKCGRCGEAHSGYSGKFDKDGIEYVVCGNTHKRMNVRREPNNPKDPFAMGGDTREAAFATEWEEVLV